MLLVDCSNKENSEKSYKGSNILSLCKKEIFSHKTDKIVPLRRNSLKVLVIMSLFLLLFCYFSINSIYQPLFNL